MKKDLSNTSSAGTTDESQINKLEDKRSCSRFWVSTFPHFETTLFILPPRLAEPDETADNSSQVTIYDSDGEVINELNVSRSDQCNVLELDQFLGACKLESGLKHGQVELSSPAGTRHFCRIHGGESASFLGEPVSMSKGQSCFFPLLLNENKSSFLCIVNHESSELRAKCRLFYAKRNPEIDCIVPPNGSRVYSIESEFSDYFDLKEGKLQQAYLRISSRSEGVFGAQLMERSDTEKGRGVFTSVM